MQIQSVCLLSSIKRIALDRIIETLLVGTMHTQLMGATSMGNQLDATTTTLSVVFRCGWFAVLSIHHLTGTVCQVWS